MKRLLLVFSLLSVLTCSGQPGPQVTGFRADFYVERIPVVETAKHECGYYEIIVVASPDRFGVLTKYDTLPLLKVKNHLFYRDERNNDIYTVWGTTSYGKVPGFILFITPIKSNAPNATHALILSSDNLCNK